MSLKCPACRKVFMDTRKDPETELEIDICPSCYGMWFDPNELGKFFQSPNLKTQFFLTEETQPLDSVGYVINTKARICPRCKKALNEKIFGGISIDICQECQGVWLDDGELQRIVLQYKKGIRDDKQIAKELSVGLDGKSESFSLKDIIYGFKSFLGLQK